MFNEKAAWSKSCWVRAGLDAHLLSWEGGIYAKEARREHEGEGFLWWSTMRRITTLSGT